MPQTKRKSDVDAWLEKTISHQRKALENASRTFDSNDSLTVNTLEAIYGRESSFGSNRRTRGISGAAGDFQLEKETARRMGLTVSPKNDQRFDVDDASQAAGKYLKSLDNAFSKETNLGSGIKIIPVRDANDRRDFSIAAYNAGEGRIARAQQEAERDGKNPRNWDDVKRYLEAAGASKEKADEILSYVDKVTGYEKEFANKSPSDKKLKDLKTKKDPEAQSEDGHWITKDGKRILIEN